MKKFFVGLLGVFILFGTSFLSACGKTEPSLSLTYNGSELTQTVEIEINGEDESSSTKIVTAEVFGVDGANVTASVASGYESVLSVSTTPVSATKYEIELQGVSETTSPIVVSVFASPGSIEKYIYVNVFSYVSEMYGIEESGTNKQNFFVKGVEYTIGNGFTSAENTITENSLISFGPSSLSRRELTWFLDESKAYGASVRLEGNRLFIANTFTDDEIYLRATTERGVTTDTPIVVPVLDKIGVEEVDLSWSYNPASDYSDIGTHNPDGSYTAMLENDAKLLIPNYADDENYNGYIQIDASSVDLKQYAIKPVVYMKQGSQFVESENLVVSQEDHLGTKVVYKVASNTGKSNIRGVYKIGFEIGYENYNYSFKTLELTPVYVKVRERVTSITVSTNGYTNLEEISLYDSYQASEYTSSYGQKFNIALDPTEALLNDGADDYIISATPTLDLPAGDSIWNYIQVWHQNRGTFERIHALDGVITTNAKTIYFIATNLPAYKLEGTLNFTSADNLDIKHQMKFSLNHVSTEISDIDIDPVYLRSDILGSSYTQRVTLEGQNSIEGLGIENRSNEYVDISELKQISATVDSVTFEFTITIKEAALAQTLQNQKYLIYHANGSQSDEFDINIFLPFTSAQVFLKASDAAGNSVTDYNMRTGDYGQTLTQLLLRNGTTSPILYSLNKTNSISAVVDVDVKYFDFIGEKDIEDISDEEWEDTSMIALLSTEKNNVQDNLSLKNNEANIITYNVGKTYIKISFTGVGEDAHEKKIEYVIYVQSYNAPDGITISPTSDSEIELLAIDSLSVEQSYLSKKAIYIRFSNANTTFVDENVNIDVNFSSNPDYSFAGESLINQTYFSIENLYVDKDGIRFTVNGLTTGEHQEIRDSITITYLVKGLDGTSIAKEWPVVIDLTVKSANRLEQVKWEGEKESLYFELSVLNPTLSVPDQFVRISTSPEEVSNDNLVYLVTDKEGTKLADSPIEVEDRSNVSSRVYSVGLRDGILTGGVYYVYLLPEDAITANGIKYLQDELSEAQYFEFNNIGSVYDQLTSNHAYFESFQVDGSVKKVYLEDIIVKIQVVVADGRGFDTAYRVFDEEDFMAIQEDLYYTVMNNIDASGFAFDQDFQGGLQGVSSDISVKLNKRLISSITTSGEIRNITFYGNVVSNAFLADVNDGTITNVTIEVNGTSSSILTATSGNVGAIVGTNNKTIDGAKVLGVTIDASGLAVGGIAGNNTGTIKNSKVEFYKFSEGVNTFTGRTVGALVGENSGEILSSFAYDYNMAESSKVLIGDAVGALVGNHSEGNITKVFAVVNETLLTGNNSSSGISQYYNSYYNGGIYISNSDNSGSDFVSEGNDFKSWVNGGFAHFKDLYQDEKIESASNIVKTYARTSGTHTYYQAIGGEGKAILMLYALDSAAGTLTENEQRDLDQLNTISFANIFENENYLVSSSDSSVVRVNGKTIIAIKEGLVSLTLYSRHDMSNPKIIEVKVMKATSKLVISYPTNTGRYSQIDNGSNVAIQKGSSRTFYLEYTENSVILGDQSRQVEFAKGNIGLYKNGALLKEMSFSEGFASDAIYPVTIKLIQRANADNADDEFDKLLNIEFAREFIIQPVDGATDFGVTKSEVPLSPSIDSFVEVKLESSQVDDSIAAYFMLVDEDGKKIKDVTLKQGSNDVYQLDGEDFLQVRIDPTSVVEEDGKYTYNFNVIVSLCEGYRSKIANNMNILMGFKNETNADSASWGATTTIRLARQNFTNIDVSNLLIDETYIAGNATAGYYTRYKASGVTGVVAPGNSSILKININPSYAYYSHMTLSYICESTEGGLLQDAVYMNILKTDGEDYYRQASNENISTTANVLTFAPSDEYKESGSIYARIWINTTVQTNSTITFVVTFYDDKGNQITYINEYLSISYLQEPRVTIDGSDVAFVAKGSVKTVTIEVLEEQKLEDLVLGGGSTGVLISPYQEIGVDPIRHIRTYEATILCDVDAKALDGNRFTISAKVSRVLNGETEYKESSMNVIIVDFAITPDKITINGAADNNVVLSRNIPTEFTIDYAITPETYTSQNQAMVENLLAKRASFENSQLYSSNDAGDDEMHNTGYYINYKVEGGKLIPLTLADRLFYVSGEEYIPYNDQNVKSAISFSEDGKIIRGTEIVAGVQMVLLTTVIAGGEEAEYRTFFTIDVKPFSDPDLPLKIESAEDFNKLNPENQTDTSKYDYILTSDIVLENYTPFATSLISSLDGNGFTIYIKSFNMDIDSSELNLSLFTTVSSSVSGQPTILKNIRVNWYNAGQIKVNIGKFKTVNIAGLAITNEGIITNCEVVAFYSENTAPINTESVDAGFRHSNPEGINVKYVNGENAKEEQTLSKNSEWSSNIAGFVGSNSGSITNSRVGGDYITLLTEKAINPYVKAEEFALGTFHINGQGNIAGFVLDNSGLISASFAKNIDITNNANIVDREKGYTAGFVAVNSNTVITSYVEAAYDEDVVGGALYTREGSSIKASGYISGFIYENSESAVVRDCYSNILISDVYSSSIEVFLASGFVFENNGLLENCYSASQVSNSRYSQMNFTGVGQSGDPLNFGEYVNCYFFNKEYYTSPDSDSGNEFGGTSVETQYGTGAELIPNPVVPDNVYGFSIASAGLDDGVWRMDEQTGLTLIEANKIALSHRYINFIDNPTADDGTVNTDEDGRSYNMPYAIVKITLIDGGEDSVHTDLGLESNPIIVATAEDWQEISGNTTSTYISKFVDQWKIHGAYRLVSNIDLSSLSEEGEDSSKTLISSGKAFAGKLYGNGFTILGIALSKNEEAVGLGLFSSIETIEVGDSTKSPLIANVNLNILNIKGGSVAAVGGLAGYIKGGYENDKASIVNISIDFNEGAEILAYNYAGSLSGMAFGNVVLRNIKVENANVNAQRSEKDSIVTGSNYISNSTLTELRGYLRDVSYNTSLIDADRLGRYSYAGGVIGLVDIYTQKGDKDTIVVYNNSATQEGYQLSNIKVTGSVNVKGENVGGAFGFIGASTNISDIGVVIDLSSDGVVNSKIYSTRYFAGGVVGQSFGVLNRIYSVHDQETQDSIEDSVASFYGGSNTSRGQLDLFVDKTQEYTQEAIGGIVGYVGSGKLTLAYSKLNVTSVSALYAGGLIGQVDLTGGNERFVQSLELAQGGEAFVYYLINEAYATGDVRAEEKAGGLIGKLVVDKDAEGREKYISLLGVNALNMLSTYDYKTESEQTVIGDYSTEFNVNAFVGETEKNMTGSAEIIKSDAYSAWGPYFQVVPAKSSLSGDEGGNSVSYYDYYFADDKAFRLSIMGETKVGGDVEGHAYAVAELSSLKITRAREPKIYENSETGHTYTKRVFTDSGAWVLDNWTHPEEDLFPSIRFKRTNEVIYLDVGNVREVLRAMRNSDVTVIVRGQYTDTDQVLKRKDVTITQEDIEVAGMITGFIGRFYGSRFKVSNNIGEPDLDTAQYVKIIAPGTFIQTFGQGAIVSGITIEYTPESGSEIEIKNGLFSEEEINSGTLIDLTLIINGQVKTGTNTVLVGEEEKDKELYVGLVAPILLNTSISGLTIKNSDTFKGNAMLAIEACTADAVVHVARIGLIAGEARQKSATSVMTINRVDISIEDNDFIVHSKAITQGTTGNALSIGAYFGRVVRDVLISGVPTQAFNIELSAISLADSDGASIKINSGCCSDVTETYIGGYIGAVVATNISLDKDKAVSNDVNVDIQAGNKIKKLYVGGYIAAVRDVAISLNGEVGTDGATAILDVHLFAENTNEIVTLIVGGVLGSAMNNSATIQNFGTIDLRVNNGKDEAEATGRETQKNNLDKGRTETPNYTFYYANVGCFHIGGVVGVAHGDFIYNTTVNTTINYGNKLIEVAAYGKAQEGTDGNDTDDCHIGSIVGFVNSASVNITSENAHILSEAEFAVYKSHKNDADETNSDSINIGGMIGRSEKTGTMNLKGSESGYIIFNGAIFVKIDADNAGADDVYNLGGMIGRAMQFGVGNTVFGGVVKIYYQGTTGSTFPICDSYFNIGGTIGQLTGPTWLQNNINYGDLFIENLQLNGDGTADGCLRFGGLIGCLTKLNEPGAPELNLVFGDGIDGIEGCQVAMTNHDSIEREDYGNIGAFIGKGSFTNIASVDKTSNYYSSAVCLTTDKDNIGTDIGYSEGYNAGGYGTTNTTDNIIDKITAALPIIDGKFDAALFVEGHKLNPKTSGTTDPAGNYHGIKYRTLDSWEYTEAVKGFGRAAAVMTNEFIIGNGKEYILDSHFLIDEMRGYSVFSSVVFDYEVSMAANNGYLALFVHQMHDNSILFSVNIKGRLEIHGTKHAYVSGMVAAMRSGKILNCQSDVDIIYRAKGDGAYIHGQIGNIHENEAETVSVGPMRALIENSIGLGSIKTYITPDSTVVFARSSSDKKYGHIVNCYSATVLDMDDYTKADGYTNAPPGLTNTQDTTKLYYNTNANGSCSATAGGTDSHTYGKDNVPAVVDWKQAYAFNYGYPSLNCQFMKNSSYKAFVSKANNSAVSGDDYDDYVYTNTYTKVPNGTSVSGDSYYYMLRDINVLNSVNEIGLSKNYVLIYDIDNGNVLNSSIAGSESDSYTGKFDGNGKIITGITKSLFNNVSSTELMNIKINDARTSEPILVRNTITSSTLSNITVGGHITGNIGTTYLGSVAASIKGSNIYTTTSTAYINVSNSSQSVNVGGLVGFIGDWQCIINYCSNYGPIYVYSPGGSSGGIVGMIGEASSTVSIKNSFNSGSILNGYGDDSKKYQGKFETGGIIGYSCRLSKFEWGGNSKRVPYLNISNCYNTGIIKSGNKINEKESYAGGIFGKIDCALISDCENEGSVEAIGKDPEVFYEVEVSDDENMLEVTIYLRQKTEDRNVYAYGIGYVSNTSDMYSADDSSREFNHSFYNKGAVKNNGTSKKITYTGTYYDKPVYPVIASTTVSVSDSEQTSWCSVWDTEGADGGKSAKAVKFAWKYTQCFDENYLGNTRDDDELKNNGTQDYLKKSDVIITGYDNFMLPKTIAVNLYVKNQFTVGAGYKDSIDFASQGVGSVPISYDSSKGYKKNVFVKQAFDATFDSDSYTRYSQGGTCTISSAYSSSSSLVINKALLFSQDSSHEEKPLAINGVEYIVVSEHNTDNAFKSARPIILESDVFIGNLDCEKNTNANIIGNGHNIYLKDNKWYSSIAGTSSFVRDLSLCFFGEVSQTASYCLNNVSAKLDNISLYGSFGDNKHYVGNITGSASNIDSYISIDADNSAHAGSIWLYSLNEGYSISNLTNYGALFAKSASEAQAQGSGIHAYTYQSADSTIASVKIENKGVLHSGNGGHGTAGTTAPFEHFTLTDYKTAFTPGSDAGEKGSLTGFAANATNIAVAGKKGNAGHEQREPVRFGCGAISGCADGDHPSSWATYMYPYKSNTAYKFHANNEEFFDSSDDGWSDIVFSSAPYDKSKSMLQTYWGVDNMNDLVK